ncbi:MAG: hypothetical protein H6707_01130 [Deltaproteobacteria bacterium]|nr:hypothetical protein [Deltaproteobacteria bacterium]
MRSANPSITPARSLTNPAANVTMTQRLLLGAATFLSVFGPKIGGWWSAYGDIISYVCLALAIYGLAVRPIYPLIVRTSRAPALILGILVTYAVLVVLVTSMTTIEVDYFYVLKYGRTLLNYLGMLALCGLYRRYYGDDFANAILRHLFAAAAIHGTVMITEYVNAPFRRAIYRLIGLRAGGQHVYRVTGLTISFGVLSVSQGFGLMAAPYIARMYRGPLMSVAFFSGVMLVIGSLFLAGRMGFYLITSITVFLLLFSFRTFILRAHTLVGAALGYATILAVLSIASPDTMRRFTEGTFHNLIEPFRSYEETGQLRSRSTDQILQGFFLPDEDIVFFFGSSITGRGEGKTYIHSDVGYVLNIYGVGILGLGIMLMFYAYVINTCRKLRHFHSPTAILLLLSTVIILLYNFKEQSLLTRHAFSVTALLLSTYFFHEKPSGDHWRTPR